MRLLFTLGILLSKQFLPWNRAAPLCCWKWNGPYRIGFWDGPSKVWTLLSEQKLQQNLVSVNDLFKSKGSVENYMTDHGRRTEGKIVRPFEKNLNLTIIGPTRTLKIQCFDHLWQSLGPTKVGVVGPALRIGLLFRLGRLRNNFCTVTGQSHCTGET